MKNILPVLAACLIVACAAACGKKNTESEKPVEVVEQQNTQLADALSAGNLGTASELADSMSLYVDDLTPEETVAVLVAFMEVHNKAVKEKHRQRDLETLRKFVDVYDIAVGINPRDMKAAFEKARQLNPAVNIDSIAEDFRNRLTEYDAIRGGELTAPAKTDSVAADSAKTASSDIPVELRPAE